MQPVLEFIILAWMSHSISNFVGARGGLRWVWASASVAGYLLLEFGVCSWIKANPRDYFLHSFPMAGLAWLILINFAARIRFRDRTVKSGT